MNVDGDEEFVMTGIIIRPAEVSDARQINVIRRMVGVGCQVTALPSETILQNEEFLEQSLKSKDDHLFCAQIDHDDKRVVGMAGLHVRSLPRARHSASVGLMVHSDFHRQGVGLKLMEAVLDLADNWLVLKRVDLTVFHDNFAAIELYKKLGFVVEGTLKCAIVRNGKYEDVLTMARIRV